MLQKMFPIFFFFLLFSNLVWLYFFKNKKSFKVMLFDFAKNHFSWELRVGENL